VRAFVTGAGGFVGLHLTAHLAAMGDDVVPLREGVDIADAATVLACMREAEPDVVYHLAGWAHVGESWNDPVEVMRVNVGGTASVLDAVQRCGNPRVLVVGSSDAYGTFQPDDLPLTEDLPLRPVSPYGASKAAAEVVARQAWRGREVPVVMTRSFNQIGPGQAPTFVVPALARRMLEALASGTSDVRVGNLDARRDLIDVGDAVRAYRLLAVGGRSGRAYNVCAGKAAAMSDVAARLAAIVGGEVNLVVDPALVRPVDVPLVVGSNAQLRADTGWEPRVELDDSLRRVVDDQRAALAV
jgi:GDP-4-dehydro-6-deoxy-D-mannose reductase